MAGCSLRRYVVGTDGRTPIERSTGRRAQNQAAEFGEYVFWKPLQTTNNRYAPLDDRFNDGVYLGPMEGSVAVLVGTPDGIVQCRTIRRRVEGERWNREALLAVPHLEIQPNGLASSEARIQVSVPMRMQETEDLPEPLPSEEHLALPRRLHLTKRDLDKYGYTELY